MHLNYAYAPGEKGVSNNSMVAKWTSLSKKEKADSGFWRATPN